MRRLFAAAHDLTGNLPPLPDVYPDQLALIVHVAPCPTRPSRYSGGSASTSSLSRPAQASLALRPIGLLNRPRRPLSRGFSPAGYPIRPPASYQIKPTTIWVEPSSTGDLRRRGALYKTG